MKKNIGSQLKSVERTARNVLFFCFFLSGLTGLLYEILWVRLFTLVFGNTVYSTAAVLAVFMGGLGAGGWWFGRFAEKRKDAVLFYGIVEIIVGLYAFVPPVLIKVLESFYPQLYHALGGATPALVAAKAVAAALILAVPTFCMGATLPLMSKFFAGRRDKLSASVSVLYGLNTAGAVTGTFLTGFFLPPLMGIHDTLLMGMVVNIGIGLLALVQHNKLGGISSEEKSTAAPDLAPETSFSGAAARGYFIPLLLLGAFISGFVSFLLEVAWTRSLALIIGSSIYAFTIILMTFLIGITLGSFIMGRYLRTRAEHMKQAGLAALGLCFLGVAVASAACIPFLKWAYFITVRVMNLIDGHYDLLFAFQFLICAGALLIPALLFGASFPAIISLYTMRTGTMSSGVGRIYFWNTLGAICGSILTGFFLIPLIGVRATLLIGIFSIFAIGILYTLFETGASAIKRLAAGTVAAALVFSIVSTQKLDPFLMTSGPSRYYDLFKSAASFNAFMKEIKKDAKLVYYHDGVSAAVSILSIRDNLLLKINGKTDASSAGDMQPQLFVAAMPMLLHPKPERVAMIGMGSGMSAGVTLLFPTVRSLDAIEIEPYIVEADRYFDKYNFHVLDDKRTHVHVEDARNYFLANSEKYDVIISEPSNHWIAGIANLYTQDFFRLTKKRLLPGGLYCQWVQFYSMAPESLSMILASYQSVYPYIYAFLAGADLFLIGSEKPINIDANEIARRFDSAQLANKFAFMHPGFDRLGITVGHYIAGPDEIRRLCAGSRLHTDNLPILEYAAPFEYFEDPKKILGMMTNIYPIDPIMRSGLDPSKLTADDYFGIANDINTVQLYKPGLEGYLEKTVALNPAHTEALLMLAGIYENRNLSLRAEDYYSRAAGNGADRRAISQYLVFLLKQEEFAKADKILDTLLPGHESDPFLLNARSMALDGMGRHEEAAGLMLALAGTAKNPLEKSLELYDAVNTLEKSPAADQNKILNILLIANRLSPRNPSIAYKLAKSLLERGRDRLAMEVLLKAYQANPDVMEINLLIREIQSRAAGTPQ